MKTNNKKIISLASIILASITSCSSDYARYPSDYQDTLYKDVQKFADDNNLSLELNTKEQYYNDLGTANDVYSRTINLILDKIAEVAGNTDVKKENSKDKSKVKGDKVYSLVADFNLDNSVATGTIPTNKNDNLINRAKHSYLSNARGDGSNVKDNLFYESRFVTDLKKDYILNSDFDESKIKTTGTLVSPDLKYEDVYHGDYTKVFESEDYDTLRRNYLVSEYVYTRAYSSIGSKLAKKLQVIEIADREDEVGSAMVLLNAYYNTYINGPKAGTDKDFSVLQRLWKGIPEDVITQYNSDGRFNYNGVLNPNVVLSSEEKQFLIDNKLLTVDGDGNTISSSTAFGSILKDIKKIREGEANPLVLDADLEAKYTGNYTYSINVGIRKAIDTIVKADYVTRGIFSDTDTIGNLPSDVKDKLYNASNVLTNKNIYPTASSTLPLDGTGTDLTVFEKDGFRYFKNTNNGESIIFFDKSTSKYFLIRILDAVDTFALSKGNEESIYDTDAKKEQIAREVAYSYATSGTFNSDSTIYWLRRCNFSYSDGDFLEYVKGAYPDLFKTESSYDEYKILDLSSTK